jgi:hypothetical protein
VHAFQGLLGTRQLEKTRSCSSGAPNSLEAACCPLPGAVQPQLLPSAAQVWNVPICCRDHLATLQQHWARGTHAVGPKSPACKG